MDQVRNSLSKKYHIADMKNYEIFQERISNGKLHLQIYCPSSNNLHSTADVPLGFTGKFLEQILHKTHKNFHISKLILVLFKMDDYKLF